VFASVVDHGGSWLLDQRNHIVATLGDWQIDAVACVSIQDFEIAQIIGTILGGRGSACESAKSNSSDNKLLHDGIPFGFSLLVSVGFWCRVFGSDEQKIVRDFVKSETRIQTVPREKMRLLSACYGEVTDFKSNLDQAFESLITSL
jgi:hypothetical protein